MEQVWTRGGDNQNAIGNLILHLSGNVRQWILSGVGGATDVRERDAEFAALGGDGQGWEPVELVSRLRATVQAAEAVIRGLSKEQLLERITVQGYTVTKLEAVFHVVEHFSGHTFQIIFANRAVDQPRPRILRSPAPIWNQPRSEARVRAQARRAGVILASQAVRSG